MADLSQLSDAQLMDLYATTKQESNVAPDTSTIQSPKKASGSMQVEPATQKQPGLGVKPSNGTPEDTAREGADYSLALQNKYKDPTIAAMAYNWGTGNVDKWLASGGDLSKVPDETLKYAYSHNQITSNLQKSNSTVDSPKPVDYSKMSDDQLKAEYAKQNPTPGPDAAQQRGMAAIQAMAPNTEAIGNAVTGVGETGAQMASGAFGLAAGALHGAADLATGSTYEQAHNALQQEENAVTYQPRTAAGQQISQNVGGMMDKYMTQPLEQGGTAVGQAAGLEPETAKHVAEIGTSLFENLALPGILHGLKAPRGGGEIKGAPADAAAKLAPVDEAAAPSAVKTEPVGPTPEEAFNQTPTPYRQYFQQPSLLEGNEGMQPEGPTLAGRTEFNEANPDVARGGLSNARQMDLQLDQNEPIRVAPNGEAFPESMAEQRDQMQQRTADLQWAPTETLDPTSGVPHPTETAEAAARSLAPDEFQKAIQTLVDRDPSKFSMPADMDKAFQKYIDIVHDDSGELAAKSASAKRFADAVTSTMLEQRVAEHPTVRANQSRVDNIQAKLADAQLKQAPTSALTKQLDTAQKTLEKSQDNIRKFFQPSADATSPFYAKDGSVHMYTFGYLPEMMKSIGALLKGIHGMVFKTLDKVIPNFKNLDSFGKIAGQGIKDFVNRQATKDWSQTVNEKPIDQMKKVPGLRDAVTELNPHAQDDLSPEELKAQFNSVPDLSDSKVGNALRNNFLQGGLMLSDFSRHPLVKFVTDSVAKAFRSADNWNRDNLLNKKTGLAPMMKNMPKQHFTEIRTLMEAYEGVKEFSESELKGRGYTDKQIEYYTRSLELQKEAFSKYNAGRVLAGLPEIDPRIAHIASYFTGDFKQLVRDSAGRVIAVLGHNNRAALGVITKRFQEMHPDGESLDMGKPTLNKHTAEDNTFEGYMNILTQLSKNNADIERLVQVYRDQQMANTNKLSQMANRGKFKSNPSGTVGGAEGSKLWQSLEKNAQDGGQQQLKYLSSLNKWSEFQKAISKSQDFIKDPEVEAPNAKAVSQKYLDNQMHRNLGELNKFTNSFVNGVADITGVGPSQMRQMANLTKVGLLNMFVGLGKFSHSLVTLLQPLIGIPEVNSVLKARGADLGLGQATALFKSMMSNTDILQSVFSGKPIADPFVRGANAYAKANDTFNTSQFNMGSITHQPTKVGNALHINVTVPESGTRAFTYMYYAHMLKDAAKGSMTDQEIFGTAHNAVQKVMADYNREAQAPVFNKMGFLGDLTRMLTTFKMNQLSQAATATKMLTQGKVMPMVTMLASSVASAGLRGFIGYNIANGLMGQITTWATKQGIMNQPTNLDQIILHMLHGMNTKLADALNFGATSALGIDMTGSLSHADDIPDDPLGTLIPEGGTVGKALGSAVQFAEHPNAQRGKAALYDVLPNSMKGIMENAAYTDKNGNYYDPHTGKLVDTRTPEDQMKRNFSFRPLDESKTRLQAETARGHEVQLGAVKAEIVNRLLSDADSKSLNPAKFHDYSQQYVAAGGDPRELMSRLTEHQGIDKHLNIEQREAGIPRGFTSAEKYQRAQGFK